MNAFNWSDFVLRLAHARHEHHSRRHRERVVAAIA